MHVVIVMLNEEAFDLKVFEDQSDARECYNRFVGLVGKGGFRSMSIYQIADAVDARDAAAAIRNRETDRIELVELKKAAGSQWVTFPDRYAYDHLVRQFWSEFSA